VGKNKTHEQEQALESFVERGLIDEIVGIVKSGKEATVYCCRSGDRLVAAKAYRSTDVRDFRDDSVYRHGRTRGSTRLERGIGLKTRTGRELRYAQWTSSEYQTLGLLQRAGADVPAPVAQSGSVILMEYIGDDDAPAPMLNSVQFAPDEAQSAFERVLANVELALACDRVHGDLSAFNILWDGERPVMIDFPQTVDARFNGNALMLLERDIDRVCAYFQRQGVHADARRLTHQLWSRFLRSEL
jgi:RIO kinase 1